ncbi:MAG: branched-chain amino acid ABC transporter permease [Kofleriaceae bacterium]
MTTRDPTRPLGARVRELQFNPLVAAGRSAWPLVFGIGIALVLQFLVSSALGPFHAKILVDIGIAIVLAVSLNIVNGFAGQFSIGHAGFMMVGGYAAAVVTYYGSIHFGWITPEDVSVSPHGGFLGSGDQLFLLSCIVAGVVAAFAGLLVGLPSLRLRGDYLAIVTLGFGEIVRVVVQQTPSVLSPAQATEAGIGDSVWSLGGALGFTGIPTYVSTAPNGHTGLFFTYVMVALLLVVAYRLKSSSKGRALLAVRENEIAAEAMGVNTARTKVVAFVTSAFFAGIGGALFAHTLGTTLGPKDLGFQKSIDIVIMVVLGGMGSITGVVLAASILTILPELFREFAEYRMPVYALALIIVMIVRPQGLFGIKELWDLAFWRRYVIPAWRKVASGWLIPKHEDRTPAAVARALSTERTGADLTHKGDR